MTFSHPHRRSRLTKLSEADLQNVVVELAQIRGWKIHHDRGDYRQCIAGAPGFPDLVLARRGTVLFVELKSDIGKLTRDQEEWLEALGSGATVWRPKDLADGTISEALT